MTKLETVRALNDSGPQLQIVESVRILQQAVNLMHEDLKQLPGAISSETVQVLEPLTRLRQDVTQMLKAYDEVTSIQRKTLDELTQEMSTKAAQVFEQKVGKLEQSLLALKASFSSIEQTAKQAITLPGKLVTAQENVNRAAGELIKAAYETRPSLWRQVLGLILAGMVGAVLVAGGQVVLNRLVPPSDVQQLADWGQTVWNKATPKERELIQQIIKRPVK